ncbi:hypothetical protein QTP70_010645 [Hemibagrus guttatus]|uniref:ribonuclease H n=1 Tax=Hemibagrus guttatus TaxID=175788 RepID=A0AAE0R3V0_9TELE|nr:hypothetical protein QTP70_010645 [Hemibagrus guttatus]
MDLLCPLSTIHRKNSSPAPWLSDVLRNNRRELRSAARKWKKSKLDTDLISYRTLLSKFSLDVTSAKTSFYKEKLETSAQDPRKLHNIFSSLLNPPASPSPSSLTAEDFATFYTEKIERIRQTFTSLPTSPTSHSQHSTTPSLTQLSTVASEEVLQITRSCNPTTCPLDPIPSAMLQTISPDLLPFITTVINGSLMSGHVPTAFKKARVIPILKKPALDPSDISNYRPVSFLSFLSKILERVVCNQLSDYLMQNNLHDPNQSGFKAAHSTETALLAVTEKLHAARSAKLSSVLILLDLSAAFDTVNHKTLLSTIRSLGICGTAWEWFASYLDGRSYQVTWKGLTSAPHRLSTGVPQGSVLGPLLFSLYTHSLGKVISSHGFSYHCYADDTQLIFSFPPSDTTASAQISACLADISSWMTAHQLKLNPSKTELLIIPGDPSPAQDLAISLSNSMISSTASARNLGVTMDNQLSFSSHVTVTRSCRFLLYNIRRIRPFLSTQATQLLVQSLVISRLDYCNSLLAGLSLNAICPLQMIQNAASRLVFNLPKFSHTTPLLRSLHWLLVAARIRFKTLMLAYKAKNGPAPSYIKALVTSRTAPRLLRFTSTARLVPPSLREKGQTGEFNVEVGLHQGSALSPFLFAMVMDQLSEEVRQESPWTMMFADDIVICSESREQVEENLERWRFALERRGMKVSGSKTEYMCVNEREGSGTVRLQGEEVKVQEFKYLGSTVQSNGESGKEVKKRVQAGWNGWRKAWGVLCDRKISARIKGKVYRTVVRPAMLYVLETVSLRKRQESELEVAELKMLRFSLGVTRLDRIRNEYIRGTAHVGRLGDKVREARLRWFGHVQRREMYNLEVEEQQHLIFLSVIERQPKRYTVYTLNDFYTRFKAQKNVAARKTIPPPNDQVLCLSMADVKTTLCRVNPRQSAGPDNITGRVLRECAEQLADVFTDNFNISLSSAVDVPQDNDHRPRAKEVYSSCLNNYRPVALTPITMKFFEGLVMRHIKTQLPPSLDPVQFPYHPNRSTDDAITTTLHLAFTHQDNTDSYGAGGNWATVGRRSRGGRRVHRQREKRKGKSVGLRIGTLNVGTMTGKGRELADMMERRKVDILCVQETRWKGSKARSIVAGFKLLYYGVDSKRNGVGVVLKEEFVRNVLEVKRVSDRVMSLKLEIEGVMLNVVSGYAPQVGCELEEKERFWSELDEVMESIPTGERVVIGADFNGHVGEGNTGDEEVMGKFGVKERNLEGQLVVDFAKRMDMGVVNTYFQKREEHRVTYKSGGRSTQVDYILCRRGNLKEISDCKVVVGESVARQYRMVVCRMTLMVCKKKRSETEKKTKWWKLKKEECCEEFRQKLRQALGGQVLLPDDWETTAEVIRETGRKVLGVSSGRRKEDKETWWWNEEVQDSIQRKRLAKKKWDMDRTEENRQEYKELQHRVKRVVSKAKQKAYDELYTRLDTREEEKDLYRLARQRDRDGKDVQQVRVIKDRDGRVLTSEESVQRRWKEYFEELMNEENEREKRVEGVNSVEQKVDKIRKDEVRKALKRMKSGKAVGPDDIPVEVWKCLGEAAVEFLASLFNRVLESERMPEEWRRSVLVPIFKNKGDVQSCSNYRGIKLMSHTMTLWERVVEARLRKVVEICEQQYGFMPRKSTTDAIFALRILMEKYRDGQRELHCVFVDLEKAYDRVPREELWYCMRKSGVAEKYVRVVQDMYERSRTVVRCAVGQTGEFNVEVGLHQGSAPSPFLFAIVMDQLSEEVRQESPWTMMFADDIVICSESREQVEESL